MANAVLSFKEAAVQKRPSTRWIRWLTRLMVQFNIDEEGRPAATSPARAQQRRVAEAFAGNTARKIERSPDEWEEF